VHGPTLLLPSLLVLLVLLLLLLLQRLLMMGCHQEALAVALAGQLWAPALILAFGFGEWQD
jgi:hypothetical protein